MFLQLGVLGCYLQRESTMFLAGVDTWEGKWANSMPWTVVTP